MPRVEAIEAASRVRSAPPACLGQSLERVHPRGRGQVAGEAERGLDHAVHEGAADGAVDPLPEPREQVVVPVEDLGRLREGAAHRRGESADAEAVQNAEEQGLEFRADGGVRLLRGPRGRGAEIVARRR